MRKFLIGGSVIAILFLFVASFWNPITKTVAQFDLPFVEQEPDIASMIKNQKNSMPKEEFLQERAEFFGTLRGFHKDKPVDPSLRQAAITKMDGQIENIAKSTNEEAKSLLGTSWTPIGPAPIPNGAFPWSGRTISIDVHPTNPDIVYVGTAQGGLYRSTDGGTNWVPLMDGAMSLAIGAIAISPTNPEIVYVGTGEHNFSADSFFGVGVYRIENASTTANLVGPLNQDAASNDVFTGRGISRIIVHPTDVNTIFVSTTSGLGGIGGGNIAFPSRGIYRSTNANSASPTFAKLTGLNGNANNSVRDISIDPNDPNIMIAGVVVGGGQGGIHRSTNALSATPTFTQVQVFNGSTSELTSEFAAIHPSGDANATFYAAVGNGGGRVLRSTDGGATWTQRIDNNFCTPQCFYDIGIAVDPTNVNNVYVGGSPAQVFGISNDGGATFNNSSGGVHVDSHVISVSESTPSTIYFGTDGGIYKSTNSGGTWQSLNNNQFFATQFMGVSVHPTDANFSIGGTQDNGTNFYDPAGNWTRVRGGDGGYTVIDQNATDTTNVRMYHTFFNRINSVVGYETRPSTTSPWSFRGCSGTTPANGINCNDTAIRFYAPLERGPGNPNTIYYGSDRLYRSDDEGTTHTIVSQGPITNGVPLSAIGVSPQDDNVRIVGLSNGQIWGTSTGSSTLTDLDTGNAVPNNFIARAVIDPNNVNTAYVTLSTFNVNNVFKTTNLNSATPTWTNASGTGGTEIPRVPVSAFIVDPTNSNTLYAGTDIGVFVSTDAGTNWMPFGTNLPRIAVFDMAITGATPRKLRVATHGKGMYDIVIDSVAPTGSTNFDFDGDSKTDVSIFRPGINPAQWWWLRSSDSGNNAVSFGLGTDTPTPADFTGDGKTDVAFFRESTNEWFVLRSEDNTFFGFPFGAAGDIPAPGDFDGDGKADATVYRPSTGTWFINRSSDQNTDIIGFGIAEDKPIVGDYDGDGMDDVAIYRPSVSQWWLNRSTDGVLVYQFGQTTDKTVTGDYTGDGKDDVAFWRPASGEWFVIRSEDQSFFSFPFGTATDIPVPGDYDGDGKQDAAVFRPTTSTWFIEGTTSGTQIVGFGASTDIPLANSFVTE